MPPTPAVLLGTAAVLTPAVRWDVVNDGVMGGVSSGRAEVLADGGVRFSGVLSLENNGGFASVRSAGGLGPLVGTDGLRLTVLGDGREWQVTVRRDDVPLRAGGYRAAIQTEAGLVTTHELRWAEFRATSFGRPVADAPPLWGRLESVSSIGLLLSDGRAGPFVVELQQLETIGEPVPFESDPDAREGVRASLAAAVRLGVPAFNGGQPEVCAAHYRTALESVLLMGSEALAPAELRGIVTALDTARTQEPAEAAWTYRRVIDAVLAR